MFHPSTERLIEYWGERKSAGRIPSRASINPGDFADLVPQLFILGRDGAGGYPIRLAGGFIIELHHRDLAGENMLDLWSPMSRAELWELLEASRRSGEPFVLTADINAVEATVGMEVSFLPLTTSDGEVSRFLGLYQPIAMVQRLKGRPAQSLSIRRDGVAAEQARPALRLVALEGRRLA
ncbi:MAG: PAS domain-containing protein [Alphaproteobacteria bacterium]